MNDNSEKSPRSLSINEPHTDGLDFWGMMLRRKWLVLPLMACGLAVALAMYTTASPVFESTSTVLVRSSNQDVGVGKVGRQSGDGTDMETQVVLIKSPRIVARAIQDHNLTELPSLATAANPVETIIQGLEVYHHIETQGVIQLSYSGPNREDCRIILEAIIETYGQFLRDTHRSIHKETVELVGKAKDELLQQLNAAESRYRQFKMNAPPVLIGSDGQSGNVHRMRLASIEQQRQQLLLNRTQLKGQILAIENALKSGGNEEVLAFVVGNMQTGGGVGQPQTIAEQLFPLMLEKHRLLRKVGPDHPQVRDITEQIEFTRSFLDGLVFDSEEKARGERPDFLSIYIASLKQQIKINEDQETELNNQFETERQASKRYLTVEAQHDVLHNDMQRKKALFDAIVGRLGEMNVLKDFGGYSMEVVTAATPAVQIGPSLVRHVGFGALGGFVIAFVIAFWRERSDRRFRAPEDIYDELGASVVSHVPTMEKCKVDDSLIDPTICTYHRPQSHAAEAYRAVRVALYFSMHGDTNKVIQVTSPNPGDGKSTLAANLATSIANSGKRVLLLEGDLRRPRVHQVLGIETEIGVPAVLNGEATLDDAVQETEINNLWALPCGARPDNPAELLAGENFARLLDTLRSQYDFVIVDTPPVLAVTDPCTLAGQVDGIYLTLKLNKNSRATAVRAAEMLNNVGGNVLGVVVNGAGQTKQYGYGHSNYTSYGRSNYGPSRYGYYGYGAATKESQSYYGSPAKSSRKKRQAETISVTESA